MRLFGIGRQKPREEAKALSPVDTRGSYGGFLSLIQEPYTGAWQRNDEIRVDTVLSNYAVQSCIALIATDVSKMGLKLVRQDTNGIWHVEKNPAYSPVLRRPNHFQNRIQFVENWIVSKLTRGNAYVLKQRDNRNVVVKMFVLDPAKVTPLVSDSGDVFYQLARDDLAGVSSDIVAVPASEIMHDRMTPLYHPLVGVSPLHSCAIAADQGRKIIRGSAGFFANGARPGGVLVAPGAISDDTARRLKEHWDREYSGANSGRVAVLGDGLKYEQMAMKAVDAQLVEQLKLSAEIICTAFRVPAYKVGVGAPPAYNNIEALNQQYYSDCLQTLIESIELLLDEGLGMEPGLGTEFDLDDLLRMDTATLVKAEAEAVGAGIKAPNESRRRLNLKPVAGGDAPYLQQQNYSLEALAQRDQDKPFAKPPAVSSSAPPAENDDAAGEAKTALIEIYKGLA